MLGAAIFLLVIHVELGAAALFPAVFILIFVRIISPWVKKKNAASLKSTGGLSAEIQESLGNFKTIVAFNRRDYFRKKFNTCKCNQLQSRSGCRFGEYLFVPVFTLVFKYCPIDSSSIWNLFNFKRKFYNWFID